MKIARCAVAAAVALLILAGAAAARPALVTSGPVTPNVGAAGITLGMTRAQVIAKLGKPVYQNLNGYMQYGPKNLSSLFDVYLDTSVHPWRVRMLGISGRYFCLAGGGPCMRRPGGVGRLKARLRRRAQNRDARGRREGRLAEGNAEGLQGLHRLRRGRPPCRGSDRDDLRRVPERPLLLSPPWRERRRVPYLSAPSSWRMLM